MMKTCLFPLGLLLFLFQATWGMTATADAYFCQPCKPCRKKSVWDEIHYYGWVQAGVQVNNHGTKNGYDPAEPDGPCNRGLDAFSGNTYLYMTGQPTDLHVNQVWLGIGKAIKAETGCDWGFQADMVFGTDAKYGQSFGEQAFDYGWGTGDYYWSIPQLFAEFGNKEVKIRVGKFASTMVHEVLPAPHSFFYTHAYCCYNTPLTLTGATAEFNIDDRWTLTGGWTSGAINTFENRFEDNGLLAAVVYRVSDGVSLSYSFYYGNVNGLNKQADAGTRYNRFYDRGEEYVHAFIYRWKINHRWFYLIESILTHADYKYRPGDYSTRSYGLNQHLIYTINKRWRAGLRFEWSRAEGTLFDLPPLTGGEGGDLYALTLGLNWDPNAWFNLRPELRFDWSAYDNGFKPFDNRRAAEQISIGFAATVKF